MAVDSHVNTSSALPPSYPKVWFTCGYEPPRPRVVWLHRVVGGRKGGGFDKAWWGTSDRGLIAHAQLAL